MALASVSPARPRHCITSLGAHFAAPVPTRDGDKLHEIMALGVRGAVIVRCQVAPRSLIAEAAENTGGVFRAEHKSRQQWIVERVA